MIFGDIFGEETKFIKTCNGWLCLFHQVVIFGVSSKTPVSVHENRAAEKLKFSFKDFCRKYEQSRAYLRICSNLQKNSLKGNFIFCTLKYPKDSN